MFPPLVGSDECVVAQNAIVLARRMQGKLEAKEWKPIIISSFILSFRLENGVRKKNFVRLILPPLALFLGVLAFSAQFFRYAVFRGPMWLAFLLLLSLLALMLVPTSLWGTYYPEAKLRADRTAAALVGNQVFLDLLRKIDLMAFKDVEKAKGRHIGSARLGIDRRIANLERIDPFVGC
jgi:membrane protein CcdC involved in cytochrome C biogenesis